VLRPDEQHSQHRREEDVKGDRRDPLVERLLWKKKGERFAMLLELSQLHADGPNLSRRFDAFIERRLAELDDLIPILLFSADQLHLVVFFRLVRKVKRVLRL